ncbi:hypothetical protein FE257_009245 [Aspergillus nanangensis]|uniref:Amine oxidase domain-containing protein n=1 Tax=Aspergillus nanangensis TaxID=2582783 RepID=A0AAD4CKC2_ASPNN|nr:hypothetical protein FE257_009245 [Aspergillus nanangensis]
MPVLRPERVAIIGGGCTGITCFWALQNTSYDVHLFEASSNLGGRIRSVPFEYNGQWTDVDTESPSFNAEASPNLVSLLRFLGITTSLMPFSFSTSDGGNIVEWSKNVFKGVLQHPWALCKKETYGMLLDVIWFKYLGQDLLLMDNQKLDLPLAPPEYFCVDEYLSRERYSSSLMGKYISPLLSVLWRTNVLDYISQFPAKALIQCLRNHNHFRSLELIPKWRRIDLGTSRFMRTMTKDFKPAHIHLHTRVESVHRAGETEYQIVTSGDQSDLNFDRIIFAIDGRDILKILHSNIDAKEKEILQGLRVLTNRVVLHSDSIFVPGTDYSWTACNYVLSLTNPYKQHDRKNALGPKTRSKSCLTSNVNSLQNIPTSRAGRIFITLNPFTPPNPRLVQGVWEFTDSELRTGTLIAQNGLRSIQNKRGLTYGFRWTGCGFLEDSVTAGLEIATKYFGAQVPFELVHHDDPMDSSEALHLGLVGQLVRTAISLVRIYGLLLEISLLVLFKIRIQALTVLF